jgi:hypothetical protein
MIERRKDRDMALDTTKTLTTKTKAESKDIIGSHAVAPGESALEPLGQRKRPEKGQFCLQVDRQTKASYAEYETAEQAALVIKRGHPVVRVSIYDTVACVNKVIELPK